MKAIQTRSYFGIFVILVFFVALNMVAGQLLRFARLDLTREQLYTLSDSTRSILADLQTPLTLKFYFSETDAAKDASRIQYYGERVKDLLETYARKSPQLKLEVFDTRPDTEEAEWAEKYGLAGIQRPSGYLLYCGLVVQNEMGDEGVIPFFDPQRQEFLEYDITKTIYSLMQTDKTVAGIYTPLPLQGGPPSPMAPGQPSEPWYFTQDLEKLVDLRYLDDLESIDADINLLIILHPKDLNAKEEYALDQYLLAGKSAFIAVDPFCEADMPAANPSNPMAAMQQSRSSGLPQVLFKNGLRMESGQIVLDRERATPVQMAPGQTMDYYAWLSLNASDVNSEDVVTGQLEALLLPFTGALQLEAAQEDLTMTPLLQSSPTAATGPSSLLLFGGDPQRLVQAYEPGKERLSLAVRLTGPLQTAFPDGPPTAATDNQTGTEAKPETTPSLQTSQKPANLVVVADVDFLQNRFSLSTFNLFGNIIAQPLNDNVHFFFNTVESLSGSTELIQIRSRGKFRRPFEKVQEIEAHAQAKWQAEEKDLIQKVEEANQKITALMNREGESTLVADQAILDEIEKFREQKIQTQSRLREVRKNLRQDKERLGTFLFLLNTVTVPLIILLYGAIRWLKGAR